MMKEKNAYCVCKGAFEPKISNFKIRTTFFLLIFTNLFFARVQAKSTYDFILLPEKNITEITTNKANTYVYLKIIYHEGKDISEKNDFFKKFIVCRNSNFKFDAKIDVDMELRGYKYPDANKRFSSVLVPLDLGENPIKCFMQTQKRNGEKLDQVDGKTQSLVFNYKPTPNEKGEVFFTHLDWEVNWISPLSEEIVPQQQGHLKVEGKISPMYLKRSRTLKEFPVPCIDEFDEVKDRFFSHSSLQCNAGRDPHFGFYAFQNRNDQGDIPFTFYLPAVEGEINFSCSFSDKLQQSKNLKFYYKPNGQISGILTLNNVGVSKANIILENLSSHNFQSTVSDNKGHFQFNNIDYNFSYRLDAAGVDGLSASQFIRSARGNSIIDLELKPKLPKDVEALESYQKLLHSYKLRKLQVGIDYCIKHKSHLCLENFIGVVNDKYVDGRFNVKEESTLKSCSNDEIVSSRGFSRCIIGNPNLQKTLLNCIKSDAIKKQSFDLNVISAVGGEYNCIFENFTDLRFLLFFPKTLDTPVLPVPVTLPEEEGLND